jgi:hypothetical protein
VGEGVFKKKPLLLVLFSYINKAPTMYRWIGNGKEGGSDHGGIVFKGFFGLLLLFEFLFFYFTLFYVHVFFLTCLTEWTVSNITHHTGHAQNVTPQKTYYLSQKEHT